MAVLRYFHQVPKTTTSTTVVDNTTVQTITAAIDAKVDKVVRKGFSQNNYSTTEKTKLSGILEGAEANVLSDWNETDTESDAFILNKPVLVTGVKGDAETDYRTGNVNLTATNIGLGNVVDLDLSKAIKSITRSGTTFTYTCLDGTTGTFTLQDNNTTYSAGTGLSLSGTTFSLALTKALVTTALGYTPPTSDTNTWRTVLCNGTSIGSNTLNLKAGTNVTLSNSNGTITISSTDTNTWPTYTSQLTNNSGFLTSHQSLSGRYPKFNSSEINPLTSLENGYGVGMTRSSGITSDWWHVFSAGWSDNTNWISQLGMPTENRNGVYYRSVQGGSSAGWVKLWDAGNLIVLTGTMPVHVPSNTYVASVAMTATEASKVLSAQCWFTNGVGSYDSRTSPIYWTSSYSYNGFLIQNAWMIGFAAKNPGTVYYRIIKLP